MRGYGERDFVRALVPLLISRLPDPFAPGPEEMQRVAEATKGWVEELVNLRASPEWQEFLIDWDNIVSWNESDYELGPDDDA